MSANKIAPWVNETCSTTGTGSLTLTGAKQSFSTFADAFTANDDIWYSILDDNGNREAGKATLLANGTLQRTEIHSTYDNGVLNTTNPTAIDLSGSSMVACTFNAEAFNELHTLITTVDGKFNATNILNLLTSNPNVNVLSDELYNKLVNIEGSNFKGVFVSPAALGTAVPTPQEGDWAYVDAGAGSDVQLYIWDASDSKWVPSSAGTITSAQVRQLLAAASDSNIFTDADKAKLDGIEDGAEVNLTASELATAYESNTNTNKFTDTHKTAVDTLGSASTKNVGTLDQVKAGTENVLPDAAQAVELSENRPLWSSITKAVKETFRCMFNSEVYRPAMPLSESDATVAPPNVANRSFINFDGVDDYVEIPTITLQSGWVVKFKFLAPNSSNFVRQRAIDGLAGNPFIFGFNAGDFEVSPNVSSTIDGRDVESFDAALTDGLLHTYVGTLLTVKTITHLGIVRDNVQFPYTGRIYDLEVYNSSGQRIHYFPLRTDVVDELSGNLIKDPEFTWEGNWETSNDTISVNANSINFNSSPSLSSIDTQSSRSVAGTYRYIYDYNVTSGSLRAISEATFAWDSLKSGVGTTDVIVVHSNVGTGKEGFICSASTTATVKNLRIIKMNELAPSADFSDASGYRGVGGVTLQTGSASFGNDAGTKFVDFTIGEVKAGQKFRFSYITSGATVGTVRAQGINSAVMTVGDYNSGNTKSDVTLEVLQDHSARFLILTENGWNGDVIQWSVTEVTDGTVNGNPTITKLALWVKELASNAIATATEFKAGLPKLALAEDIQNYFNELKSKFGLGTKWSEVDHDVTYNFETYYGKDKYLVQRPLTAEEVALAPPPSAGRSFINFDGVDDYVELPSVDLQVGNKVVFYLKAPSKRLSSTQNPIDYIDGNLNRFRITLGDNGKIRYSSTYHTLTLDGEDVVSDSTDYPTDDLYHKFEATILTPCSFSLVGAGIGYGFAYEGAVYGLEIFNTQGERIHYYPLRTDAVDYLAGNLVKDEEFTWEGNWEISDSSVSIIGNSLNFNSATNSSRIDTTIAIRSSSGTYRYLYDYNVTSGSIKSQPASLSTFDIPRSGNGTADFIAIYDAVSSGKDAFLSLNTGTTATVKNFRVIKLNELSPSADFSNSAGFITGGGVVIDTVNKQAVFGSGTGTKYVSFILPSNLKGKDIRIAFKVSGATQGTYRIGSNSHIFKSYTSEVSDDFEVTYINATANSLFFTTVDGWDGNVKYLSVTEVTDGTVNGSPTIVYESDWSKLNQ